MHLSHVEPDDRGHAGDADERGRASAGFPAAPARPSAPRPPRRRAAPPRSAARSASSTASSPPSRAGTTEARPRSRCRARARASAGAGREAPSARARRARSSKAAIPVRRKTSVTGASSRTATRIIRYGIPQITHMAANSRTPRRLMPLSSTCGSPSAFASPASPAGPAAPSPRRSKRPRISSSSRGVARSDQAHFSSVAEALDAVQADVLVDYTHAAVVKENVLAALEREVGVVIGSSGLSADDYDEIDALAREKRVGVIAAGNFSVSAALLLRFATEAARHLPVPGDHRLLERDQAGRSERHLARARRAACRGGRAGDGRSGRRDARRARGPRRDRGRNAGALGPAAELHGLDRGRSSPRRGSGSRSATTRARALRRM